MSSLSCWPLRHEDTKTLRYLHESRYSLRLRAFVAIKIFVFIRYIIAYIFYQPVYSWYRND
jgi:hypothetical protein